MIQMDEIKAPGAVTEELEFWIKANTQTYEDASATDSTEDGDAILAWLDVVGASHLDDTVSGDPTWQAAGINYNGAIDFDGDDSIAWDASDLLWMEGDEELFMVFVTQADIANTSR